MNQLARATPRAQVRLQELLCDWQGSGYHSITKAARALSAGKLAASACDYARAIALTRALYCLRPLSTARLVWSGLGRSANLAFRELPCAGNIVLTAPVSTSYKRDIAEGFSIRVDSVRYVLEIEVPATARGAELPGYEDELLLPAGTRLELTGDSYEYEVDCVKARKYAPVFTVVKANVVGQRVPRWAR